MRILLRLFGPLAAFALVACAGSAQSEPAAKPAMWKLADEDTTIYLFGTLHILPPGFTWRTPKFDAVAASADTLVLEIADQGDARQAAERFRALATSDGLPPLHERVPPAQRPVLAEMLKKAGLSESQLDGYETWAAALTLGAALYHDVGASAEHGVEQTLSGQFTQASKPIEGLETTAQQLGFFDTLPEASQRRLLASMVEESEGSAKQYAAMAAAWSRGDINAIAVTFDDELRISPDLAEILIRKRNANWTAALEKRLETPGTVLVAVGAGHLAGKDSVVDMLRARGLKVQRVQ